MQIAPLKPSHWEEAAALVAARVQTLRTQLPMLPVRYGQPEAILRVLAHALTHALAGAHAKGYARVATDVESANLPGAAFWMRHFQPVASSVVRCFIERTAVAHAQCKAGDFW